MLFPLATLAIILILVAAAAAALAIVWHFLTYRLKGDLGAWLAALCAAGAALLMAVSIGAFVSVPWDSIFEAVGYFQP